MTHDEAVREAACKPMVNRTCWNCNGAHEHLKTADYVVHCLWGCGGIYWKGVQLNSKEAVIGDIK